MVPFCSDLNIFSHFLCSVNFHNTSPDSFRWFILWCDITLFFQKGYVDMSFKDDFCWLSGEKTHFYLSNMCTFLLGAFNKTKPGSHAVSAVRQQICACCRLSWRQPPESVTVWKDQISCFHHSPTATNDIIALSKIHIASNWRDDVDIRVLMLSHTVMPLVACSF